MVDQKQFGMMARRSGSTVTRFIQSTKLVYAGPG